MVAWVGLPPITLLTVTGRVAAEEADPQARIQAGACLSHLHGRRLARGPDKFSRSHVDLPGEGVLSCENPEDCGEEE